MSEASGSRARSPLRQGARLRPNPATSHWPMRFLAASSSAAAMGNSNRPAARIAATRSESTSERTLSSLQAEAIAHQTTRSERGIAIRESGTGKRRWALQWIGTARTAAKTSSTTVPLGATTPTTGSRAAKGQKTRVRNALGLPEATAPAVVNTRDSANDWAVTPALRCAPASARQRGRPRRVPRPSACRRRSPRASRTAPWS